MEYTRKQLASKALRVFSENYESNFRGKDFEDKYNIEFSRNNNSFRITWFESHFNGKKYRYDVYLFLGYSEPLVLETELVRTVEQTKILK